jgi:hypothetical protein
VLTTSWTGEEKEKARTRCFDVSFQMEFGFFADSFFLASIALQTL